MWWINEWGNEAIPHFGAGFVTPLFLYFSWIYFATCLGLFLAYEVWEWYQIKDKAYRDLGQHIAGFHLCVAILFILYTLGVIPAPII
jgi:CDP-diglyceride synthetase